MKTALFTNFSNEPFTGYWNGKGKTFAPGQSVYMPDYLARHFAKHLTNRELLKKGLERSTSPKRPEDVPEFMELFNQACKMDTDEESTVAEDGIDVQIEVANKNRAERGNASMPASVPENPTSIKAPKQTEKQDPTQPQIVLPPEGDEDDDESAFPGKPTA